MRGEVIVTGKLLLVLVILLIFYGFLRLLERLSRGRKSSGEACFPMALLLVVKDQEEWVEGFLRKVADCRKRWRPAMEMVVVDDHSQDRTADILQRLRESCGFELVLSVNGGGSFDAGLSGRQGAAVLCFDARGLRGNELLRAPLFNIFALFARR